MKLDALLSFTMALLTLVLISAAAFGADGELALVRDGASAFTVVHAADAPASVRTAARELREYVEKATRARLPIVEGAAPAGTACISLGDTALARAAGIDTTGVPLEGFRLVSRGGHLFILGPDTRDGVCTFLEEFLDVRWLLPGPLGEDVPPRATLLVPPLDRTAKPGFFNRTVSGMQIERPAVKEWSARQKLGGSLRLEHNHAWHRVVPPALHAQHPEWFAELDGKRPPPSGAGYKIETTNPELIEHYARTVIEAFRRDPQLTVASLSPNDSAGWSTSAESRAFYDTDPHGRESITPLILKFYNDVARIVGREFPDRKLAGYVYARYLHLPGAGVPRLEPNLYLVVALSIGYGYRLYREGVRKEWERVPGAWAGATRQVGYYDLFNWLKGGTGAITPPAPEILNFAFPRLAQLGMRSVHLYGTSEWSQAAVNNYALARLAWNPALDAEAVCDEFYRRAYGAPAGAKMRELSVLLDAAVKRLYHADRTASFTATPRYLHDVLAANFLSIESLYLDARRAAESATAAQRARLDFFGANLAVMQSQLRGHGFLPEATTSPLHRTDAEADAMLGRVNPGFGVALAPGMRRTAKTIPPVRPERAPTLDDGGAVTPPKATPSK